MRSLIAWLHLVITSRAGPSFVAPFLLWLSKTSHEVVSELQTGFGSRVCCLLLCTGNNGSLTAAEFSYKQTGPACLLVMNFTDLTRAGQIQLIDSCIVTSELTSSGGKGIFTSPRTYFSHSVPPTFRYFQLI